MPATISRADYAAMFGPTTGDRVRLADTDLIIEVERDLTAEAVGAARTGGSGANAAIKRLRRKTRSNVRRLGTPTKRRR